MTSDFHTVSMYKKETINHSYHLSLHCRRKAMVLKQCSAIRREPGNGMRRFFESWDRLKRCWWLSSDLAEHYATFHECCIGLFQKHKMKSKQNHKFRSFVLIITFPLFVTAVYIYEHTLGESVIYMSKHCNFLHNFVQLLRGANFELEAIDN